MKVFKTFFATLAVVMLVGIGYLFGKGYFGLPAATEKTAEDSSTEKSEEEKNDKTSITDEIKKKTVNKIVEKAVEKAIEEYGGDKAEDIQKVMDNVDEKDKDRVTEILTDNMSLDSIGEVQSYISNNDVDGLMEYAEKELTAEEYSELTGIFEKYSDEALKQLDKAAD